MVTDRSVRSEDSGDRHAVRPKTAARNAIRTSNRATDTRMAHFVTTVRSSNCVTESALVHTPTLPGFAKVRSSTSYNFDPLKYTSSCGPFATTRNVLHW